MLFPAKTNNSFLETEGNRAPNKLQETRLNNCIACFNTKASFQYKLLKMLQAATRLNGSCSVKRVVHP